MGFPLWGQILTTVFKKIKQMKDIAPMVALDYFCVII